MGETGSSAYDHERQADLPEASIILTSVKPELTVGGTLQTRTMLTPDGSEIFSGINSSSNVQEQIPSAFCSGGYEKYDNF